MLSYSFVSAIIVCAFFSGHMQDDGNYRVVEGSDFVITRVAFRDNTSKYYINDRGSNFTEVTKLLKGKGVDLDNNRFLILQVLCSSTCELY
jgi:chromosome segregation ATPase